MNNYIVEFRADLGKALKYSNRTLKVKADSEEDAVAKIKETQSNFVHVIAIYKRVMSRQAVVQLIREGE